MERTTKGIILVVFGLVFSFFAWYPQIMSLVNLVNPQPTGPPGANVRIEGNQFVITFTGDTSELKTISVVHSVTPPGGGIADMQSHSDRFSYKKGLTINADMYPGLNEFLINGMPTQKYPTHPGEYVRTLFQGYYYNAPSTKYWEGYSWSGPGNQGAES
jgi:hypothetical protein